MRRQTFTDLSVALTKWRARQAKGQIIRLNRHSARCGVLGCALVGSRNPISGDRRTQTDELEKSVVVASPLILVIRHPTGLKKMKLRSAEENGEVTLRSREQQTAFDKVFSTGGARDISRWWSVSATTGKHAHQVALRQERKTCLKAQPTRPVLRPYRDAPAGTHCSGGSGYRLHHRLISAVPPAPRNGQMTWLSLCDVASVKSTEKTKL